MKTQIQNHVAQGNKKLPKTTSIFNCGTATECPSKRLGLCQCASVCYAKKAEIIYPQVKPYRERQRDIVTYISPVAFAFALLAKSKRVRKTKMKIFRFNESGDFENQKDIQWFSEVCRILSSHGVKCYGYTARTDLDLEPLLKYSTVQVSNDLNNWVARGANRFRAVKEYSENANRCLGDCRICNKCIVSKGKEFEVKIH
jgi:hypothetical protein